MKRRVSSSELAWLFVEKLREFRDCPAGVAVAIIDTLLLGHCVDWDTAPVRESF